VGAERAVGADPQDAVEVHRAAGVLPGHAEDELPLGFADPLDDLVLGVLRMPAKDGPGCLDDFLDRMEVSRLAWLAGCTYRDASASVPGWPHGRDEPCGPFGVDPKIGSRQGGVGK
jgi:hypothetical protein